MELLDKKWVLLGDDCVGDGGDRSVDDPHLDVALPRQNKNY